MGFFSKLAFWKKDDFGSIGKDDLSLGKDAFSNMDFGRPGNEFADANNLGMPPQSDDMDIARRGMPDVTNYRGVGDAQNQNDMNRTIQQQLGPDYMSNDSQPGFSTYSPRENYPGQQQQPGQNNMSSHELQVISAKLDAVRATLDAVNQRLANLERAAYPEQQANTRRNSW